MSQRKRKKLLKIAFDFIKAMYEDKTPLEKITKYAKKSIKEVKSILEIN